jgi:hypothetical protein
MLRDTEFGEIKIIIECIALPPDLDLNTFLSIPESVGRFTDKRMDKNQILTIGQSIQASPVFTLTFAKPSVFVSCITFLKILQELDLTVKGISNTKSSNISYNDFLSMLDPLSRDDDLLTEIIIVVINLFPLISDNIMENALKSLVNLEEFQREIQESIKMVTG